MGEGLRQRIRQQKFSSTQQESLLNVMVAANYVREQSELVVRAHGITLPQYNVLRILRGAHPDGHPRYEIARRMLDRAPDVTRIIDRLAEKKLLEGDRGASDRRKDRDRGSDHPVTVEECRPEYSQRDEENAHASGGGSPADESHQRQNPAIS